MPLFLPTKNPLVDKALMATQSMYAWMRDLTAAFNGGNGFAPADATYFLRTSDSSLPNARVATNSATITLDYSTPGQVKWDAVSSSPVVAGSIITLTDAQVKTLPTTPVTVIAAPGSNTRFAWFAIDLQSDFSAGAYTNVNADAFVSIEYSGHTGGISNYIANDSTIPLTFADDFFGASDLNVLLQPYTHAEPVNDWGNLALNEGFFSNTALVLTMNNGGSGNLTGGNAANTLRIAPFWIPVASA